LPDDHALGDPPGAQYRSLPLAGGRGRKKRLTARTRWDFAIGWDYIKTIRQAGNEVDPADLPPRLEWETPAWDLYIRISTQWRYGFGGRTGLDYGPAIELMRALGWDVDLGISLLRAIETETLRQDEHGREKQDRN
jgi:hypothetical protein